MSILLCPFSLTYKNSSSSLSMDRNKIEEDYSDVEEPRLLYSDSEIEDPCHRVRSHEHSNDARMNAIKDSLPRGSLFHEEEGFFGENNVKCRKQEGSDFKKDSLFSLGIPTRKQSSYKTSFKFENKDVRSLGNHRGPEEVIEIALAQLTSGDWRSQISGLETIVQLSHTYSNANVQHYMPVLASIMSLCKSPRSQVARGAIQSLTCLFLDLGHSLDTNKLEDVADVLLLKSSDSNKFIRSDAQDALEALLNSVPVQKVVNIFCRLSSLHKNNTSRNLAVKLLADLVLMLGRNRLFSSYFNQEPETLDIIVSSGAQFLLQGNSETRAEGKRLLAELSKDCSAFETVLLDVLKSDKEIDAVYKSLQ